MLLLAELVAVLAAGAAAAFVIAGECAPILNRRRYEQALRNTLSQAIRETL
jgi:hypothetical protein